MILFGSLGLYRRSDEGNPRRLRIIARRPINNAALYRKKLNHVTSDFD